MQPDFTLDEYLRFRKKWGGHICPPSSATHPRDRWDMFYVYMFITRFTGLKDDIPGFLTVEECVFGCPVFVACCAEYLSFSQHDRHSSLEDALLDEPGRINPLVEQVLLRFILNLRPNTRNTRLAPAPADHSATRFSCKAHLLQTITAPNFSQPHYRVYCTNFLARKSA